MQFPLGRAPAYGYEKDGRELVKISPLVGLPEQRVTEAERNRITNEIIAEEENHRRAETGASFDPKYYK